MKTFEDVQNFLGGIEFINSGGCGIAAHSMYLWLKKNNQLTEDFKIIYLFRGFWDKDEYNNNRDFLNGNSDKADSCVHAIVQKDGKLLDSRGDYDTSNLIQLEVDIPNIERFMPNSLNQPKWNSRFNRKKNIPLIEEKLGIDLSDIDRVLNY